MASDFSQIRELSLDLGKSTPRIGSQVAQVVRRTAAAVERDAKMLAPVDTGNLRNSIGTSMAGGAGAASVAAEVGPTANYGAYVEYGTSRMAPQPYLGPALDRHEQPFVDALGKLGNIL